MGVNVDVFWIGWIESGVFFLLWGVFFGWHEFWMVGNEGLGMEAVGWELNVTETTLTSIVQPTTTCEAWIVKTPMRIFHCGCPFPTAVLVQPLGDG